MLCDKMTRMLTDTRLRTLIVCKFTNILPFPKNKLFPLIKRSEMADIKPSKHIDWFDEVIDNDGAVNVPDIDPEEDLAVLQYTGGHDRPAQGRDAHAPEPLRQHGADIGLVPGY